LQAELFKKMQFFVVLLVKSLLFDEMKGCLRKKEFLSCVEKEK